MNQLVEHIPHASIPYHLGGQMPLVHQDWLRHCLICKFGDTESQRIQAFFENIEEIPDPDYSRSNSVASTPMDEVNHTSDFESEESKETVCEKQNVEDQEKEVSVEKPTSQANNSNKTNTNFTEKQSIDSAIASNGNSYNISSESLDMDVTNDIEDSVHLPETGGFTMKDVLDYVRQVGKDGLVQEYLEIKGEPPKGTFFVSK